MVALENLRATLKHWDRPVNIHHRSKTTHGETSYKDFLGFWKTTPKKKKKSIENLRKKKEEKNFQRPYLRGINSWNRSPNWASKPWQKGRCTNLKDHQLVLRSKKSFHRRQVVDFLLTPKSGDSKNLEKVMSNWRSSPILEEESDKNGMKPSQSTSSFAVNPSERFRNSENSHYPTNSMYTLIHAFITVHYSPLLQWLQFSIPF